MSPVPFRPAQPGHLGEDMAPWCLGPQRGSQAVWARAWAWMPWGAWGAWVPACSGESRAVLTGVSKLDLHIWGIGWLTWAWVGNGLVTKDRSCVAYVAYERRS